jgi:hypothetical protein
MSQPPPNEHLPSSLTHAAAAATAGRTPVEAVLDELQHCCFWFTDEVMVSPNGFTKPLTKQLLTFLTYKAITVNSMHDL